MSSVVKREKEREREGSKFSIQFDYIADNEPSWQYSNWKFQRKKKWNTTVFFWHFRSLSLYPNWNGFVRFVSFLFFSFIHTNRLDLLIIFINTNGSIICGFLAKLFAGFINHTHTQTQPGNNRWYRRLKNPTWM